MNKNVQKFERVWRRNVTNDILGTLQSGFTSFSKGQRRIAKYILDSYDKAAFLTASKLGKTVGVSESTVVRFAVELGFDGYPAMQKAMQEMVLNRLTAVQRIEVANDRFGDQDVVSLVLQSDADKLRQTEEIVDREMFRKAVDALVSARRIYLVGVRSSAPLANFLGYYLNYMFDNIHRVTVSGTSEMFEQVVGVSAGDVVLTISFPRYSTSTAKCAQYCRSTGATVIALTDSMDSPVAQNADLTLIAKSGMVSLVDTLVAPLSLINALIVAISARREKEITATFNDLERIWDQYDVYKKQENGGAV